MSIGVWLCLDSAPTFETVVSWVERSNDLYLAASDESAHVVLASPSLLSSLRVSQPVVVLAEADHLRAAREAIRFKTAGILAWPEESDTLCERLIEACEGPDASGSGTVLSVVGATGGCGASSVVALLGRAFGSRATIVDLNGSEAGQRLFARERPNAFLSAEIINNPSSSLLRRLVRPHSSGASCVFGSRLNSTKQFSDCIRSLSEVVIVDGHTPSADVALLVVTKEIGSIRSAELVVHEHSMVVVCDTTGKGMPARKVKRSLDAPIAFVPHDRFLRAATRRGRVPRRGPALRAVKRIASELIR